MDQMKDSIADQYRRRRTQTTKSRCFLSCFGDGTAAEDAKPKRKLKSKSQSQWFSWSKFRIKKFTKKTVPFESATVTDVKVNQEKGSSVLRSKSNKKLSSSDELPANDDDENQTQEPPVAGEIVHEKANKTRSGKGIFLRNSKSMNHLQLEATINSPSKQGPTFLTKSKSAKTTTSIIRHINQTTTSIIRHINQPAGSDLLRPSTAEISQSHDLPAVIRGRGEPGAKKTEEKNKGSFDRLVGISIIVMVLLIMAIWGKLCAILCSSAWLYFYPLLLRANKKGKPKLYESVDEVHTNSQLQKKKVVFHGFLQREH